MTAILGTLPFLATLWLLIVLGAAVLEESGAKIVAALKGESMKQPMLGIRPVRTGERRQAPRAIGAIEPLRVAA